jgi:hypothetical protein
MPGLASILVALTSLKAISNGLQCADTRDLCFSWLSGVFCVAIVVGDVSGTGGVNNQVILLLSKVLSSSSYLAKQAAKFLISMFLGVPKLPIQDTPTISEPLHS